LLVIVIDEFWFIRLIFLLISWCQWVHFRIRQYGRRW